MHLVSLVEGCLPLGHAAVDRHEQMLGREAHIQTGHQICQGGAVRQLHVQLADGPVRCALL